MHQIILISYMVSYVSAGICNRLRRKKQLLFFIEPNDIQLKKNKNVNISQKIKINQNYMLILTGFQCIKINK